MSATTTDERSREQRRRILQALQQSGRGHIGGAFSALEIVRVLYDDVLRVDPANPDWEERDRFIFSKGHSCLALYVVLAEKGFFPAEELSRVSEFGAMLGGHPEADKIPGVEASTGSLGHGLSIGVGLALAARMDRKDWRTFVLVGDGESNEGTVWEAAMSAGKHGLDNLVVIVDYNRFLSYNRADEVQELDPLADKWRAFNFAVREIDGHDVAALRETFAAVPFAPGRPNAIICNTMKGKGLTATENNGDWHHKARVSSEEFAELYAELDAQQ